MSSISSHHLLLVSFTSVNAQCKGDVLTTPVRGKVPLRAEYVVEDTTVTPIEANSVRILNYVGCCVLFYVLYAVCLMNGACRGWCKNYTFHHCLELFLVLFVSL